MLFVGVKKGFRRKKKGTKIFNEFIKNLQKKKINKIFLEVDCKNTIAISFYNKFDFKKINIRKKYYKNIYGQQSDAILMCKCLTYK